MNTNKECYRPEREDTPQCAGCVQPYLPNGAKCGECSRFYKDSYTPKDSLFESGPQVAAKANEWPDNLYRAVFGISEDDYRERPLMLSEKAIERAMGGFTERERSAVLHRFTENLTLREIGNIFGVTQERARQILAKALRKFRHPSRVNFFIYGENYQPKKPQIQDWSSDPCETKFTLATPIEELDLTVRSFHCLKRSHCNTVGDIASLTDSSLRQIRNLGRKSYEEIKGILEENGFNLKEEENF